MLARYMQLGGPMMWPLAGCSVLLTAVLVERFWVIGIKLMLLNRSLPTESLAWHRRIVPFFTDVPPSLGLLGTVVGVVQSFHLIDGQISGDTIGTGLGVACITTIFGMGIAITASLAGYLLDGIVSTPLKRSEAKPC
ncbi:MAG: MotA/TolQ/ExbB proton channel family protein [Phycisphaeraceae bacterium]|nr:MotA/TolQ/ExbB proton channel family protein [Phycisphaeraceae bacterium]